MIYAEAAQIYALARAVYYGQRGRISAREVYDQVNVYSCLTLILACIVLAGQGDLTDCRRSGLPVRPRQAQDARALACISARIWSAPYLRHCKVD